MPVKTLKSKKKNLKNSKTIALREEVYKALEEARFDHHCRTFNDIVSLLLELSKGKKIINE